MSPSIFIVDCFLFLFFFFSARESSADKRVGLLVWDESLWRFVFERPMEGPQTKVRWILTEPPYPSIGLVFVGDKM